MSSLKSLSSSPIYNLPGECLWDTKSNFDTQYETGQIISQSANPKLYNKIGKITDAGAIPGIPGTLPTTFDIYDLIYENGLFMYTGLGGVLGTSIDGITWTARTSNTSSSIYALAYGNGLYLRGGVFGQLGTSTDGITWSNQNSNTSIAIETLSYGNGLYVRGGGSGTLGTSTDAITWSNQTSGTTSTIRALVYANGLYLYGGVGGVLATSTDAITWTSRTSGTTATIYRIIYENNLYTYASSGEIGTSTNGITWTAVSSGPNAGLAYGDGIYCTVGGGDFTFSPVGKYSTNAITWTTFPLNPDTATALVNRIAYGNSTFVYIGYSGITGSFVRTKTFFTYNPSTEFILPTSYSITEVSKNFIKGT